MHAETVSAQARQAGLLKVFVTLADQQDAESTLQGGGGCVAQALKSVKPLWVQMPACTFGEAQSLLPGEAAQ